MKNITRVFSALIIVSAIFFTACGGGGGGSETNPPSSLFATKTVIEPGAICANGGIQIDMGFDVNGNNILDPEEITKTEYVCNGEDGADGGSHPFVVYTAPTPNETDVESDSVISAVFNTEMDGDTINTTTFTVTESGGAAVSGTVTYSGIVAVFQPDEPLVIDKKYTVNLTSTIEDDSGTAMGYDHKIYFTTADTAKVKYYANGATSGTVPVDTNSYSTGDTATILGNSGTLMKGGYPFMIWNTKENGTGTAYSEGDTVTISDRSIRLYGIYTEPHTVTYYPNGAITGNVPVDGNTYIYGDTATVLENTGGLTNGSLFFKGWNTESDGTGTSYDGSSTLTMMVSDINLYAVWVDDPFLVCRKPGDTATISIGNESHVMVYANNQDSITFPASVSSGAATLTSKFFIGQTEVTNAQYAEVLQWAYDNGKLSESGTDNLVSETIVQFGSRILIGLDQDPVSMKISYSTATHKFSVSAGYENHPVECISWFGAIIFCNWLTEMRDGNTDNVVYSGISTRWQYHETFDDPTKTGYRLPFRMEWEYAARYRGDDSTNTVSGYSNPYFTTVNSASGATTYSRDLTGAPLYAGKLALDKVAVYGIYNTGTTTVPTGVNQAAEVGSKEANTLGLYDMSGNVAEWCYHLPCLEMQDSAGGNWMMQSDDVGSSSYNVITASYMTFPGYGFRIVRTK